MLWAATYTTLNAYAYGLKEGVPCPDAYANRFRCPTAVRTRTIRSRAYGERKLWLTTSERLYKFDPKRKRFDEVVVAEELSTLEERLVGPSGYPTIVLRPTEQWWSNALVASTWKLLHTWALRIFQDLPKADGCGQYVQLSENHHYQQNDNRNIRIKK